MSKSDTIFREVIVKYNSVFTSDPLKAEAFLADTRMLNIEYLVELTMAEVGGYEFVDADGYDFSDGSECKTASVSECLAGKCVNVYVGSITNVRSKNSGKLKSGDIRVVMYNPFLERCDYFFIPQCDLDVETGVTVTAEGKISIRYNRKKASYGALDNYRVADFVTLATMTSDDEIEYDEAA